MSELYKDPAQPVEKRVKDLLARMTLDEKIGQLVQSYGAEYPSEKDYKEALRKGQVGSRIMCGSPWAGNDGFAGVETELLNEQQRVAVEESRLGIPLINGRDIIHGHRTVSPLPLAQAASFDPAEVKESARLAAKEASAECVHWTFAPMMDVCRDPRWGRVVECFGEDPYLGEEMAVAMVQGFQGKDMSAPESLVACAKHFAGYGYAEGGRDYESTEITDFTMYNTVLRPFRAAVKRGKVGTLMTSFQTNNGEPSTRSEFLLNDVLRKQWGFDGFVVSDWGSIEQVEYHGAAQDEKDCVRACFKAGTTMEMVHNLYSKHLPTLLKEGKISQKEIDEAVASVLRIKFRAGLFEHPYCDLKKRAKDIFTQETRDAVRKQAANCMVLAKNNGILPLSNLAGKKILLAGPYVHERLSLMGTWNLSGRAEDVATLAEAFKEIESEYGFKLILPKSELTDSQLQQASREADLVICCMGEHAHLTGEFRASTKLGLPTGQEEFLQAMRNTGKPFVVLCCNGRVFPVHAAQDFAEALLYTWHGGTETARAIVDVVMGKSEPGGRFPITVPASVGQIPIYYGRKYSGKMYECAGKTYDQTKWSFYDGEVFKPMYPFGYGLTYTSFKMSSVKLAQKSIKSGKKNEASVSVTNTGKRTGTTVVQCYLRDIRAEFTRPGKELIGFKKITLAPGKSADVKFPITEEAMGYWDNCGQRRLEAGIFQIGVGFDSDVELDKSFELKS